VYKRQILNSLTSQPEPTKTILWI